MQLIYVTTGIFFSLACFHIGYHEKKTYDLIRDSVYKYLLFSMPQTNAFMSDELT